MFLYMIIFGFISTCGILIGLTSKEAKINNSFPQDDPNLKKIRDIEEFNFYRDLTNDGKC